MPSQTIRRPSLRVSWIAAAAYWLIMGGLIVSAVVHPSEAHHYRFARNLAVIAFVGFLLLAGLWKGMAALMNVSLADEIPEPSEPAPPRP